ncbi:transposase [Streptomyces sp. NPDC048507]|uniref:transposase n=1 Tax=Streptomyces sp. NPDC048507 TaxID=3365560 RepID=UPI00372290D0
MQWTRLELLLPRGKKPGRPPLWTRRQLVDGIRFRIRTGVPWRDGTWQRIFAALQAQADAKGLITWDLNIDSTVCRAHRHAAGAREKGICRSSRPAGAPSSRTTHGLRRSRGGLTTKLHLAVEQGQKPMSIVITAGQRDNSPQFEPVLKEEAGRPVRSPVEGVASPGAGPVGGGELSGQRVAGPG